MCCDSWGCKESDTTESNPTSFIFSSFVTLFPGAVYSNSSLKDVDF